MQQSLAHDPIHPSVVERNPCVLHSRFKDLTLPLPAHSPHLKDIREIRFEIQTENNLQWAYRMVPHSKPFIARPVAEKFGPEYVKGMSGQN